MVGTPAVKVTPSSTISFGQRLGLHHRAGHDQRGAGGRAACAMPQALAWNIGTTGIATSWMPRPNALGAITPMVCSNGRAVRVDDALGVARGAARVAHRGGRVLVRDVEVDRLGVGEQRLVVEDPRVVGDLVVAAVVHDHDVLDRRHRVDELPQQRQHRAVDEDDLVLGVVGDVGQLLGEEPDVERVQDPAGARRGEVELQVALGVPAERADPAVGADAEGVEDAAQLAGALRPLRVGRPGDAAGVVGDDRPVAVVLLDVPEDRVDRSRGSPASGRAWPESCQ